MTGKTGNIAVERDGHVATVTLDRPEALNALSGAMCDELHEVFDSIGADGDVWCMILAANGTKAFCVGADLKERAGFSRADFETNRKQIRGVFEALRAVPQPTVAAPFGFALGGGMELVLSCDLSVAASGTIFGLPEVRVGLLPAAGGTQLLARHVGLARAKELILRGARIDADEARAMGFVGHVVPREELDGTARSIALDLCESSPVAVRAAKKAIDSSLGVPIERGIELEHDAWRIVIESEDRVEGIAAFNDKRSPRWKNR